MAFQEPAKAEPAKAPLAPSAPDMPAVPAAPAPAVTDAPAHPDFAAAHQRLLEDATTQFAFSDPPVRAEEPWRWPQWLSDAIEAVAPFTPWIFWGALALLAAFILFQLAESLAPLRLPGRDEEGPSAPTPPPFRPTPTRARALLNEADALAASGQFAAAARILLHRSIDDMEDSRGLPVRPGMTSRELAQWDRLDDNGRTVFARIAQTVERAFFAGQDIGAEDYRACRESYERFALTGARP